jgi:tripartite-type tricarboxylate transporter receptor subunit TctC
MKTTSIPLFSSLAIIALTTVNPSAAAAPSYPSKPIRLVVGFPAGGGPDATARVIAPALSEKLGQQVIVDNRGGAGGVIATELVARAPNDGYTMLLTTLTHVVNPAVYRKVAYHPIKDFSAVTRLVQFPFILVSHPNFAAKTTADLVRMARTKPGLVYASAGNGTTSHLSMELFMMMAKVEATHVPYKGAAAQLLDMVAGRVEFGFASPAAVPHLRASRLRGIAVTSAKPSDLVPGLPAVSEAIPGYEVVNWFGLTMPAGSPREAILRINREANAILSRKDIRDTLILQATEPNGSTPEEFAKLIESENRKWPAVVKAAGMEPG